MNHNDLLTKLEKYMLESSTPPRAADAAAFFDEDEDEIAHAFEALESRGLAVRTKKGRYMTPSSMGLTGGTLLANARGFAFLRPAQGGDDIFISEDNLRGALHGDTVLVRPKKRNDRPSAVVERILRRNNERVIGTFERTESGARVIPDDPRIFASFAVNEKYGKGAHGAITGDKVVFDVLDWSNGHAPHRGKISEVIGRGGETSADIRAIVIRSGIKEEFPTGVLNEADSMPDVVLPGEAEGREDFRGQNCFTIDGLDAKDFDDAVAIELLDEGAYRLYVHIADVTHYVREGSQLDDEAWERGTSVYLCDRVIPMLPEKLSNGICSLNPHEDRLCLSCVMDVDGQTGDVTSYRITPGIIHSKARLFYEEVNAMLQEGDTAMHEKMSGQYDDLTHMARLQEILQARRERRGSIEFEIPEPAIELDESGEPVSVEAASRGVSNRMIEEFMLLANETVATHALMSDLPFLYRVHEPPDPERLREYSDFSGILGYPLKIAKNGVHPRDLQRLLQQVSGNPEEGVLSKLMLRALQRARYAPQNLGHFGLSLKDYCHFTSPIRRYPDLFIHRVLKAQLSGALDAAYCDRLTSAAPAAAIQSSEKERVASDAEREVDQLMMARYMTNHIGEDFDAIIDGLSDFGIFVELPNTISGMVPTSSLCERFIYRENQHALTGPGKMRYRMGDKVRVRCVASNPETRRIDFEIISGE